jgi:hypothetical protein
MRQAREEKDQPDYAAVSWPGNPVSSGNLTVLLWTFKYTPVNSTSSNLVFEVRRGRDSGREVVAENECLGHIMAEYGSKIATSRHIKYSIYSLMHVLWLISACFWARSQRPGVRAAGREPAVFLSSCRECTA